MLSAEDWANLTDKQRTCISHFIRTGNKLASYRAAYNIEGMNEKTWKSRCQRLFASDKFRRIIDKIQAEAVRRAGLRLEELVDEKAAARVATAEEQEELVVDAEWVLKRAALLADFNLHKFLVVDEAGTAFYDFTHATDEDWYCINEYSYEKELRGQELVPVAKVKVRAHDKLRALELVGKHVSVQAYRTQVGVGNPDGTPLRTMTDEQLDQQIAELSEQLKQD